MFIAIGCHSARDGAVGVPRFSTAASWANACVEPLGAKVGKRFLHGARAGILAAIVAEPLFNSIMGVEFYPVRIAFLIAPGLQFLGL